MRKTNADNSSYKHDFDSFVTENSVIFCAFARRYTFDQFEIEDLVQEALIQLWRSNEVIESPINYVFTSIKNRALNNIRSNKKINYKIDIDPNDYCVNDFMGDLIALESSKMIADTIAQLPEQSRNVMLLIIQGLKGEEVAKELGISVSSVKTLKTLSIKKLKLTLPKKQLLMIMLLIK